jgi:hypothetical protein
MVAPRRLLPLSALLACALTANGATAASAGCALPADPFMDAGPPSVLGQNGKVTTPLAYQLDEHYGDPIDIGVVWLQPTETMLRITMQVRDLHVSGKDHLLFEFSWEHPDAPRHSFGERPFPISVHAFYDQNTWRFSARSRTASSSLARLSAISGEVDLETDLLMWDVPLDREASGTRMTGLFAFTVMGPGHGDVLANRASDQSDLYGGGGQGDALIIRV